MAENVLAIHAIGHTTVPWYTVTKVFDVKGALETGGEKSAEGCDQRSEATHHNKMNLIRSVPTTRPDHFA